MLLSIAMSLADRTYHGCAAGNVTGSLLLGLIFFFRIFSKVPTNVHYLVSINDVVEKHELTGVLKKIVKKQHVNFRNCFI